jgi:CubicO group peptidase (beta-lactamase class C family)
MKHIDRLDSVLEEIITRWGIPGLAVGIVDENKIAYSRCLGVQSLDTRTPVTENSIFCVASIGKCFVATAVMQLVERGALQLDTPVVEYLPYFRLEDPRYWQITLRQILSHTSGMPDMDESEYQILVEHPETDEGAAERYVRGLYTRKMIANPGEKFFYSNIAYNVLGDLIAKVSGQTFEDYMREHILRPAGMVDSTFFSPEVPMDRLAMPHIRAPEMIVSPVYPYHRADAPASFLHTTITDMCGWAITSMNRGTNGGEQILSSAGYESMWTPVTSRGFPPFYEDMCLGWNQGHLEGIRTISHGGGGFGWTAFLLLLPERQQAAVILSNQESSAWSQVRRALVSVILDQEPLPGRVSWMIPINRALQAGGIQAAYQCYDQLKKSSSEEICIDDYGLISLVYQLVSAKKLDLSIEVLKLNLQAFPNDVDTYTFLARLHIRKGETAQAEEALRKALTIEPENMEVMNLLDQVTQR